MVIYLVFFLFWIPPQLLSAVGTSAAQDRCIFPWGIHFSMFGKYWRELSIDFKPFETFRDPQSCKPSCNAKALGRAGACGRLRLSVGEHWPHGSQAIRIAVEVSFIVFRSPKPIANILRRFRNIEKWMQHDIIHRSCAAEVPTPPNSRGGSQNKKSHQFSMKNHH